MTRAVGSIDRATEFAAQQTALVPCPVCRYLVELPIDSNRELVTCHPHGHELATRLDIDGVSLLEIDATDLTTLETL